MWIILILAVTGAFSKATTTEDSSPLFLTPYIERGNIEEAKNLALVTGLSPNVTSYSGFITVDEKCGDHLFFWFFPSQNDWLNDPVTVWLNGGPGESSMYGLLEIGPYRLRKNGKLKLRKNSWNRNSSLIFIDNPVGTGYSFTEHECYATEQEKVRQDMLKMLTQFFRLFPDLKPNPFFLAGESYAGKYIPAIAHAIHNSNPKEINLQGIAIGNGWIDPVNQLVLPEYLYQLGLIDDNTKERIHKIEVQIPGLIEEGNFSLANDYNDKMLFEILAEVAGFTSFYNFLYSKEGSEPEIYDYVDKVEIRQAIHVGNGTLNNGSQVYKLLYDDVMKSVRPWLEELLDNDYRVILYNGQLDIMIAYPLTVNFIKKLNWKGAEEYKTAGRDIWYVGKLIAGYAKTVRNFTEILVRNAGHSVPVSQPKWALDLYNRFIFNKPFKNK